MPDNNLTEEERARILPVLNEIGQKLGIKVPDHFTATPKPPPLPPITREQIINAKMRVFREDGAVPDPEEWMKKVLRRLGVPVEEESSPRTKPITRAQALEAYKSTVLKAASLEPGSWALNFLRELEIPVED